MDDYPDRLAFEIAELERVGFQVDTKAKASMHILAARGQVQSPDFGMVELTIIYPDSFPFLRPEVFATGLRLDRHQNPYEGNLCLLDRSTREWAVDDAGAWLVTERVPLLLGLLAEGGAALRDGEAPQGEPWLNYLRCEQGSVVFVPQAALEIDAEHQRGRMTLRFGKAESPADRVRALLQKVTVAGGRHGIVVAEADSPLADRYPGPCLEARWVRVTSPPQDSTAPGLLDAAVTADRELATPRWHTVGGVTFDIVGCLVNEEIAQGEYAPGWAFIVRLRRTTGAHQRQEHLYLARGERYAADDLAARIPTLAGLPEKTVLVLGAGGLGGPLALELARCGVGKLGIIDGDNVEAGNTVRWPIGMTAVGWPKANLLAGWIAQEYPYTSVDFVAARIGQVITPGELNSSRANTELDVVCEMIADADLVVDATAELGVQHLLASVANDVPQLYVWATEGAAGGMVARVRPGTGCWMCLQMHIEDGTIPLPSAIPGATLQPRGCAHPTFTGASFDLTTVANQAVRVAIAQLLGRSPDEQDISVCRLRTADEWTPAPIWETIRLAVHPRCGQCSVALAA